MCVWLGCDGLGALWLGVEGRVMGTGVCGWLCHPLRLDLCVCV